MVHTFKQRQRARRAVEETEVSVPAETLSSTSDTAEFVAAIDALLED